MQEYLGDTLVTRFETLITRRPEMALPLLKWMQQEDEQILDWMERAIHILKLNRLQRTTDLKLEIQNLLEFQAVQNINRDEMHKTINTLRLEPHVQEWLQTGQVPSFGRSTPLPKFCQNVFRLEKQDKEIIVTFSEEVMAHFVIKKSYYNSTEIEISSMNDALPWFKQSTSWFTSSFNKSLQIQEMPLRHGSSSSIIACSDYSHARRLLHQRLYDPNSEETTHMCYSRLQWAWILLGFLVDKPNLFDELTPEGEASFERCIEIMTLSQSQDER